jgi:hypothetical protein
MGSGTTLIAAETTGRVCYGIGLSSQSEDGLSNAEFQIVMDRVGNSNRSSVLFNVEHRF